MLSLAEKAKRAQYVGDSDWAYWLWCGINITATQHFGTRLEECLLHFFTEVLPYLTS